MHLRLLVLAVMLLGSPVLAQDAPVPRGQSNFELVKRCQSESRGLRLHCYGYFSGMMDMHAMMGIMGIRVYCLPEAGLPREQAVSSKSRPGLFLWPSPCGE